MKIFIEIFNINGDHILSKNVSFDNSWYDIQAFNRFYRKLDDLILTHRLDIVRMLPTIKSKRFTLTLITDQNGDYIISDSKEEVIRTNNEIVKDVSDFFGITDDAIKQRTRRNNILKPRQFSMFLLWLVNRTSLTQIGYIFNLDHATVLHAITKAIPGYYTTHDEQVTMAIEYFSNKYDYTIIKQTLNQIMNGMKLSQIDRKNR